MRAKEGEGRGRGSFSARVGGTRRGDERGRERERQINRSMSRLMQHLATPNLNEKKRKTEETSEIKYH